MDLQKLNKNLYYFITLILVSVILFWKALFLNKPLGLDALGHLSKISYMNEFGWTSWNHAWYSGSPLLAYYSPLFYWLGSLFSNNIFGVNFICYLSILLTAAGIFLLIDFKTKNKPFSFLGGLSFLSVLSISYYFISVGNHPFVFSLWTLPLSMYFLERTLQNKKYLFPLTLCLAASILSHVFVAFFVFLTLGVRILFLNKDLKEKIKIGAICLIPAGLVSSLWWIPFLKHSSAFSDGSPGYIASIFHLLGFGKYTIWGEGPGEIGVLFMLLIVILFLFLSNLKKLSKDRFLIFLLCMILLCFLWTQGVLGKYYPTGVGAERAIILLGIFISITFGYFLQKFANKKIFIMLLIVIIVGLAWNFNKINYNYDNHSYNSEQSRYGFVKNIELDIFSDKFEDYRFGTAHYVFAEPLTYFYTHVYQTSGYYDQGMMDSDIKFLMLDSVWETSDINSTYYFFDWFGIKYFEYEKNSANKNKFNNYNFSLLLEKDFEDYPFQIYEYNGARKLIECVASNVESVPKINEQLILDQISKNQGLKDLIYIESDKNISIKKDFKKLSCENQRISPDKIIINYSSDQQGVIIIKESYHGRWNARDIEGNSLEIFKAGPGMMAIIINKPTQLELYQAKEHIEYLGILLTFIGVLAILFFGYISERSNFQSRTDLQ
jgi:hypothetical protein